MAVYHFTASMGSRSSGASAAAKFDYLTREGAYSRDASEVRAKESDNMPSWAADSPRDYWVAADEYERANGRLYREVHFALPAELSAGEQRALARRFARDVTGEESLPHTLVIHEGSPRQDGQPSNPHAHLMWSERGLDGHDRSAETWFRRANLKDPSRGGAKKSRAGDAKDWLPALREQWGVRANEALERAGEEARVDHRSLAERAAEALSRGDEARAVELAREPNVHLGPVAIRAIERSAQGKPVPAALERARAVRERNGVLAALEREYRQLKRELAVLAREMRKLLDRMRDVRDAMHRRQRERRKVERRPWRPVRWTPPGPDRDSGPSR